VAIALTLGDGTKATAAGFIVMRSVRALRAALQRHWRAGGLLKFDTAATPPTMAIVAGKGRSGSSP